MSRWAARQLEDGDQSCLLRAVQHGRRLRPWLIRQQLSAGGNVLAQDLPNDPRSANLDARTEHGGSSVEVALQLVPDTNRLDISNWNTGVVLLDLHGDLQLLCLDWQCLDLCASPDAGSATASNVSADLTVAVDENGTD